MLGNENGFTGLSGNWLTARQFLPDTMAGQTSVRFRVLFDCNAYEFNDGMAFDFVTVQEAPPDVGVIAVPSLKNSCPGINSPYLTFTVKNFGIRTLTPVKDTMITGIQTNVTGSKIIIDTFLFTRNLVQGDTISFTFKTPLNIFDSAGFYQIAVFTMIEKDKFFYDSVSNDTFRLNVTVYPNPVIGLPDSVSTREPDTIVLKPVQNPLYSYKWQDKSTDSVYDVVSKGKYSVQVTNTSTGCTAYDSTKIILLFSNLAMNKIIAPVTVCNPVSNVDVICQLKNAGNDTITVHDKIEMYYVFNNGLPVHDTLQPAENLLPGDTLNYTFLNPAVSMATVGTYSLKAYLHFPGDTIKTNDTITKVLKVFGSPFVHLEPADTIIAGFSYTLTAPAGFVTYKWTDLKTHQTSTGPSYLAQTAGTCIYKLTVTDLNNCPASDSVTVSLFFLDIGTKKVDYPVSSCSFNKPVKLEYTFTNFRYDTIESGSKVNIGYRLNGSSWTRDTIILTENLLPGDSVNYTFAKSDTLSSASSYVYKVYTNVQGDIKLSNDTLTDTVYSYGYPVVDLCNGNCVDGNILSLKALQYTFNAGAGYGYKWNNGSKNQKLTATKPGLYFVKVTDTLTGCHTTDSILLNLIIIDGMISSVQ